MFFEILKDIGEFLFDYVLHPDPIHISNCCIGRAHMGHYFGTSSNGRLFRRNRDCRMPDGEVIQGEIEEYHRDSVLSK